MNMVLELKKVLKKPSTTLVSLVIWDTQQPKTKSEIAISVDMEWDRIED